MHVLRRSLWLLSVALLWICADRSLAESTAQAPIGEVVLSEGILPAEGRVEIIDVPSGARRVLRGREASAPMAVPAHPLVVIVFDSSNRPVGLTRVQPKGGERLTLKELPRLQRGKGQLGLTFTYPRSDVPATASRDIRLELAASGRRVPADTIIDGDRTLHAFWFDVPSGDANVVLASKVWATERPLTVSVPERNAALPAAADLLRRPTLRVRLASGDRLPQGTDVSVEVFPCEKQREFISGVPHVERCEPAIVRVGPPTGEFTFAGLLPGVYAYRWRGGNLASFGWIEIPTFSDVDKQIDVDILEVAGRVQRRGDAVAAHLAFELPGPEIHAEADTDEQGRYRIRLAEKGRYSVKIRAEGFPDFPAAIDVSADTSRDFDLPANRYVVHVQSAEDGKPLAKARVDYEVGSASWNSRNDPLSAKSFTGDDGSVELPPIPEGQLKVSARMVGYRPGEAPPVGVERTSDGGDVVVSLRKAPSVAFRLVEPEGTPASGAWIWTAGARGAPPTGDDGSTVFDGDIAPGAPFFAFDGRGRMAFTRWNGEKEQVIEIPPSGPPVTIRFQTPSGQPIKRLVRVGVDDIIMFDGPFAQQVTGSGSQWSSGADGVARIIGLPAKGILTVFPGGRPELAVTRPLPVTEEIVVTVPALPESPKVRVAQAVPATTQ